MGTLLSPGFSITVGGGDYYSEPDVQHDIGIDLTTLPSDVNQFVRSELNISSAHGVTVTIANKKYVNMGGLKVNGYFGDADMELVVAAKKPLSQWLPTFVHETCHRDQFTQDAKVWGIKVRGCDPMYIIDLWLNEVVELKPITLQQMINGALKVELDCEKRAVEKIKRHKLPINVKEYIQKANAYIYFYQMFATSRKWYTIGGEPYNIPEVWQAMPTTLTGDYTALPTEYKRLFAAYCFKGNKR
jgi:hypothetical protein